jgi:hypothetical protein
VGERYTGPMRRREATERIVRYRDRDGVPTSNPSEAATGEVVHYDIDGTPIRRTRFFLQREELPWLPVTEPAFLLWVLVALGVVWIGVAVFLELS